jgi:pSer/pThr/pTyr-binding forkhead associated (FHA) protein
VLEDRVPSRQRASDTAPTNAEVNAATVFVVHPLRRRPDAPYELVTLGRAATCDVVIDGESVSRMHAFVHQDGGAHLLMDAGSRTGTTLNGEPVAARGQGKPHPVSDGDRVGLGKTTVKLVSAERVWQMARSFSSPAP